MIQEIQRKVVKGLQEAPGEFLYLARGAYPAFVTDPRGTTLENEVPVFMFHTVEPQPFRQQLEYLQVNGYRTLTLLEFMAFLAGSFELRQPAVLLTFDDGDKSWYQVAYPLLQEYGFHAAGFVVPAYIREESDPVATRGWLSWPELAEMERSGVFDIQSHTYFHARIFVEPHLVDFYHPGYGHNALGLDVPWIEREGCYTNQLAWGTPIYRFAMRCEGRPRYLESAEIRTACIDWVASHGGADAFRSPEWRKELEAVYRAKKEICTVPEYESRAVQSEKILEDLSKGRSVLEERLNKAVTHLCYPEGAGSALAVSLSEEAGYRSNFWVVRRDRRTNKQGDSPYAISRLKDDYILRLPGRGRQPLLEIFKKKLNRRVNTLDFY
jgi:peptidoglycan/xylan/chitin deacetylase (PgdA/CDA1 family)